MGGLGEGRGKGGRGEGASISQNNHWLGKTGDWFTVLGIYLEIGSKLSVIMYL